MFAKLYNKTEFGQILVKLDDGDDGPEVRFFFEPEGLGVCWAAMKYADDENKTAWDKAEDTFEKVTEEAAEAVARRTIEVMPAGLQTF